MREKDTLVYSFTEDVNKLQPLHPIMPKKNFKMAKEALDHQMVRFLSPFVSIVSDLNSNFNEYSKQMRWISFIFV